MIVTERLILRPARREDLAPLHDILRNPVAMRYWSTAPHPDMATTGTWLQSMLDRPQGTDFILEKQGTVIGKAGAWQLPEVGFILSPDHWHKGLAQEAMRAIIPHLWAISDVPALTADVDPRNTASLGLLESLGFAETHRAARTFFINGQWADSLYLALPRPAA